MLRIPEDRGDALHVVVVQEAQEVGSPVDRPGLRPKLPGQAVADLKKVLVIEAGPQALVALVVGDAVAQPLPHPAVVIPVEGLPHEDEVRLQRVRKGPQLPQVLHRQAVGHIQPQPVDAVVRHPAPDRLKLVLHHRRILEVQLHQLIVALPALVPEAVVIIAVAVEINVEPVLVGAVPLLLLHVPEGPEAPAHVVEHPIQQHPDAGIMEGPAHALQVLLRPQAAVHPVVVPGVISVAVTFEEGIEQHRVRPQLPDVLHPIQQAQDAVLRHTVVVRRRAAQPQGIDLVHHRFIKPHSPSPLSKKSSAFIIAHRYSLCQFPSHRDWRPRRISCPASFAMSAGVSRKPRRAQVPTRFTVPDTTNSR